MSTFFPNMNTGRRKPGTLANTKECKSAMALKLTSMACCSSPRKAKRTTSCRPSHDRSDSLRSFMMLWRGRRGCRYVYQLLRSLFFHILRQTLQNCPSDFIGCHAFFVIEITNWRSKTAQVRPQAPPRSSTPKHRRAV